MKTRLAMVALIASVFVGCSGSSGGGNSSGPHPSGANTSVRDYHFVVDNLCQGGDEICGAESNQRCEIKKSYPTHQEYCVGLQDGRANEYCARSGRKAEYLKNCGSSFEDTNLLAAVGGSGDGCETDRKLVRLYLTRSELCRAMLEDMRLHPCIKDHKWYDKDLRFYGCEQ